MIHAKPKKKPVAPGPKKIGGKRKEKKAVPEIIKYELKIQNGDWVAIPKWKPFRTTVLDEYTKALERFKELQQDTRCHNKAESSLGWYWKRLLPAIPLVFSRKHKKIEIKVSQVAESVLLFVLKDDTHFLPPMF
ncbi:MAG: hypothetical protein KAT79_01700, partial [candidate division Zixibacteria bacterium]|nr:hypothetical protein [candidate division Zixibacteria bacterium]